MNTLTNNDINYILYNIVDNYDGCYMSDEGYKIKDGYYYIYNLNNSKQKGSHWVSLYKNKSGKSFYFDSYGFVCDKEIEPYIKPYKYNHHQIQDINSSSCGYYCIAFIVFMKYCDNKFDDFIKMFDKNDFKLNEFILYNFLKRFNIVK
jgi:hypothetical protein